MKQDYDAIIVGGGVIGAAIFHRLSETFKKEILLIEKSRFGLGSTGWSGGLVRCYHDDAILRDMAVESHAYYHEFKHHTEIDCGINECGFLYFTYPSEEYRIKKIASSWVDQTTAAKDFPFIHWNDLAGAVYEPTSGYMDTLAVTTAWIRAGRRNQANALEGVSFDKLLHQQNTVMGIEANGEKYYAPRVILCTGAWTNRIAHSATLTLPQTIRAKSIQMNTFQVNIDINCHPAFVDPIHGWYGRPDHPNHIYLGCPVPEWDIDPDNVSELNPAYSQHCYLKAGQRFKWIAGAKNGGGLRRFDGYTEDERGLIAESESVRGLFYATGFSGGGFKLAPAVASRINNLLFS